ncbi:DUF938 domain-containing protein [Sphingomonas sp. LY160]|uniref:DUF938 domain-containing protein n=1 Tax=Sphingomonas sp. LY160 TaxID=3095342 RepID=UPI002ADEE7CA|nr:DUF938 domain-containing protein [Sphingomonas sp. LY160]MEA1071469.1 DUF938 domain-containing protein [Sphingomonas sp. LY160]
MSEPSFPPYNVGDLGGDVRRHAPAAARNVVAIGDVLADWLPSEGTVLEVASGSGEHALAFARRFPAQQWQPSDPDPTALASIAAWREGGPCNLLAPLTLDASSHPWPIDRADAVVSINMVHISPWQASLGLIDGAARLLPVGAPLILYGPWREADVPTAPSNEAFDLSLKERDPRWGLRSVDEFAGIAWRHGLVLVDRRSMPANNIMLRFDRQDIGA